MSRGRPVPDRLWPWAELAAFTSAVIVIVVLEVTARPDYLDKPSTVFAYTINPETTWAALAVVTAPLVWWLGRGRPRAAEHRSSGATEKEAAASHLCDSPATASAPVVRCLLLSVFLFALSVSITWFVGLHFRGMPPAYHDEFSYLFQAKTFLAGRLYFPPQAQSEFFDQMHVLNDNGVFASRYFPGVGLWLAPWVALGRSYWGQYLAGGLITVCAFWIGRELAAAINRAAPASTQPAADSGLLLGFLAGFLCAISPAMVLFGNLLLSHHATTLGLATFVLCYLRALRSESWHWPLAGGVALSFAMLCRPLTAFGFALPFGLHLGWLLLRGRLVQPVGRLTAALAPLLVGVALLAGFNAALTGNPLQSPYGLYTQIYSPNHVYGFHNVSRGEKRVGPKVLDNYNRWAEELTVPRAFQLMGKRAAASAHWSCGRVGTAWLAAILVVLLPRLPTEWKLLAASAASLHAVYFPFAFVGIFELSYVFESVPVLCLLGAGVVTLAWHHWRDGGRWARPAWLVVFLVAGFSGPLVRLEGGIAEVRYPRRYYADFDRKLAQTGVRPPALVFVLGDPADRDRELVTNSPTLDDPIIRVRASEAHRAELVAMYPDRQLWFYDVRNDFLARILTDAEVRASEPTAKPRER